MSIAARSPYIPSVGPVYNVQLFHATRRVIVRCTDQGMVGAPYPLRFLTCPSATHGEVREKGWIDNGMFVPDPKAVVPYRHQVRMPNNASANAKQPGLEIGDPEAVDFPKRAVLLFRYDVMEIGIDQSRYSLTGGGPGGEFVCHAVIELDKPFGGLDEADLDPHGCRASNKPLSLAAHQAAELAAMYISKL